MERVLESRVSDSIIWRWHFLHWFYQHLHLATLFFGLKCEIFNSLILCSLQEISFRMQSRRVFFDCQIWSAILFSISETLIDADYPIILCLMSLTKAATQDAHYFLTECGFMLWCSDKPAIEEFARSCYQHSCTLSLDKNLGYWIFV